MAEPSVATVPHEPTLSMRVLWPFVTAAGDDTRVLQVLAELGIDPSHLADGERRVSCRRAMAALARVVERLQDPTLGLRAGDFEEGAFDAIERAWRHEENLGAALRVTERYGRLLHEGMDIALEIEGGTARVLFCSRVEQPAAANDFLIATMLTFARRHCIAYAPPREIHFAHEEPAYAPEYARHFETRMRFGMPCNAIVFPADALRTPLHGRNRTLAEAFVQHTAHMASELPDSDDIAARVRRALQRQQALISLTMPATAQLLDMSAATLRRKLASEGAAFRELRDEAVAKAAIRHMRQPHLTVTQLARLLGFSDVRAFSRAFKRWTGKTPSAFREQT